MNDFLFFMWKIGLKQSFIIWVYTVYMYDYMYLPNPSARAGWETGPIFLKKFNRFEFRVFILDQLSYKS